MADKKESGESSAGAVEAEAQQPKKTRRFSGKKLVMFIVLPLLLLVGGGAASWWFLLRGDEPSPEDMPIEGEAADQSAEAEADSGHPSVFFELPEVTVNLVSDGKRTPFLRTTLVLDIESEEDQVIIESVLPRIVDHIQAYLRSLRVEDLQGADGMQRLRDELLTRARNAAKPAKVKDVLFKQMLVQQ